MEILSDFLIIRDGFDGRKRRGGNGVGEKETPQLVVAGMKQWAEDLAPAAALNSLMGRGV